MATDEETAEKVAKVLELLRGLDVEAETRRLRESWHDALKRLLPHGLPANLTAEGRYCSTSPTSRSNPQGSARRRAART